VILTVTVVGRTNVLSAFCAWAGATTPVRVMRHTVILPGIDRGTIPPRVSQALGRFLADFFFVVAFGLSELT